VPCDWLKVLLLNWGDSMLYDYKKYKDIVDFVQDVPKSKTTEKYTILFKCNGIDNPTTTPAMNSNCFGCLFCVFGNSQLLSAFKAHWGENAISQWAETAFCGTPVRVPVAKKALKAKYRNLESFTAVDETTNIQPWAVGIVNHACSCENRVSMEVPVFNNAYSRNGRLDICSITEDWLITMESKTTLDDALGDERFVEQHEKYTVEIEKATQDYVYLTLVGGKETDVFPVGNPYCTGNIGDKAKRFYRILIDNDIKFITANALWCIACKYLTYGNAFAWDNFITEVFSDPECVGLLSAGKVMYRNGEFIILPIQ